MPSKNYGVYYQGAMFSKEDFNAAKVILMFADEMGIYLFPEEKNLIRANTLNSELVQKLCHELHINPMEGYQITDYSFFLDDLLTNLMEWIESDDNHLNTESITAYYVSDSECEFIFADNTTGETSYMNCCIFAFNVPLVWERENVCMPKDTDEAVAMLRKAGEKLLKDDIDWRSRLGELIGSTFG